MACVQSICNIMFLSMLQSWIGVQRPETESSGLDPGRVRGASAAHGRSNAAYLSYRLIFLF